MAADYTYGAAPVLNDTTGEFAIGATGVFRPASGTGTSPMYDLNGSSLASITVGPKGAHPPFKADIPNGILDFGSVLLPKESLEQQEAGLAAVTTANNASTTAASAVTTANQAASDASAALSAQADFTTTGDVDAQIATAVATALETNQTPIILRYNFSLNSWEGKVRPATTRPVIFVHPQSARPALNGTTAGGTLAAVPGRDYLFEAATI